MCLLWGVVPIYHINQKTDFKIVLLLNQKKLPVYSEFALKHFDLILSTQSEKETRYIQYAAGEVDEIRDSYCTTIV